MSNAITDHRTPIMTIDSVIRECTKAIEKNDTAAGRCRGIRNPMLKIYLGKQVQEYKQEIEDTFFSCWSDRANQLVSLNGAYTREQLEDAIYRSTQIDDPTFDLQLVRTAWFWDIMDDDFDTYFSCVKQDFAMPVATSSARTYFIFCSQRGMESQQKTRERLKEQLIPWAKETGNSLIVFSDATTQGPLRAGGIAENYRLAADLMLIMNSQYDTSEDALGTSMTFALKQAPVFSGSYYGCRKNATDIVSISLLSILKRYRALGKTRVDRYGSGNSVQDRICGAGRSYADLVDSIFTKTMDDAFQVTPRLWADMPHTEALDGFRAQMGQGEVKQQGFFARLFGARAPEYTPEDVIASLGGFWTCTVKRYFLEPAEAYLNTEKGEKLIKDQLYNCLSANLTYDEMCELLAKESEAVRSLAADLSKKLNKPQVATARTADEALEMYAKYLAKVHVAGILLEWLAQTMKDLSENAAGFDDLLARVQSSIREEALERSVVHAYGSHMERLTDDHRSILTAYIRPSKKIEVLLCQLKETFLALVNKDSSRIYFETLTKDMKFRMENGGNAAAVNVITDCFKYDMQANIRLPLLKSNPGTLYCIMNDTIDTMGETVDENAIGKRFLVGRSDRIERVCLFEIDPESIMYA